MSSRALRKRHGRNELEILERKLLSANVEKTSSNGVQQNDRSADEENTDDMGEGCTFKKQNLFALALDDDDVSGGVNEEEGGGSDNDDVLTNSQVAKPSRKKKNKKKKNKKIEEVEDLDEVLAAAATASSHQTTTALSPTTVHSGFNPLGVQLKYLNPENEMKRKFGQKVVSTTDSSRGRRQHKTYKKATHLVTAAQGWHPMTRSGLEMCLTGQEGESHIFQMEHKPEYQKAQHKFWDAVDSMEPENLMAVLQLHPYHIDTLLQLSEVCRMSEDPQMAAELIERALYAYESSFHPLYNMTTGRCLVKYRNWENRGLFLALFRHLINVGNRGCYKTSLEYCKLLLGLDPEADPLCTLLLIDFYALRSDDYDYLIQLYRLWNSTRNLRVLPNFALSVPLAMFHASQEDTPSRLEAEAMLQESLMMFPGILQPLLDECGVNTEEDVNINKHFGADKQYAQPASLKQLVHLYVGRTFSCWKAPECIAWLEKNVKACCEVGDSQPQRFKDLTSKGHNLYRGLAPQNVCRHLILSDIKKAVADLPREVTATAVLSYDPLPPTDTVSSYQRGERRQRQISNQGFLSAFINSLRPNFDLNAPINPDEEAAAALGAAGGGQGIRGAGANLMNAVRELLNNIEMAPPERDDDEDAPPPQDWD